MNTPKPDPSQRRRTPEELERREQRRASLQRSRDYFDECDRAQLEFERAVAAGEATVSEDMLRYESYILEAYALGPFMHAMDPDNIGGSWPRVSVLCPKCGARIVMVRAYRRGEDYTVAPINATRDIGPGRPMSFADPSELIRRRVGQDIYERGTHNPDLPITWASHKRVALTCQRARCSWTAPFRQTTLLRHYVSAVQSGEPRFTPPSSDMSHLHEK